MTEEELLRVIEQAASEGVMELDLSGNNLTVLPPEIGKLTQLKKLILGKYLYDDEGDIVGTIANNLSALPVEIGQLKQLEELQVVANRLSSLPGEIGQLTSLQEFDLSDNKLSSLPGEIGQLTSLQELDLSDNKLSTLPGEIVQLTSLQSLDLSDNQLSTLPPEIGQLVNLQSLNLSDNLLSALPGEIGQLTNLRLLSLWSNRLSHLPAEIGQLANLQFIDLMDNKLSQLPAEMVQLTNLKSLYLSKNKLSKLPHGIIQLTNLLSLDLSDNQLSELPSEVNQLINLQALYLGRNQLETLSLTISQLSNLKVLDLSSNNLSQLPPNIGDLTLLEELLLGGTTKFNRTKDKDLGVRSYVTARRRSIKNYLSSLPAEIGQLTNLQTLDLWGNQLSALPAEIGQLTNLQTLDLKGNQLSALPAEIGQLTNLQTLNLGSNQLSALPPAIRQLPDLTELDLRGNPVPIPPEILGTKDLDDSPGDVNEILDFYFRVQDPNETEPLYEAKFLIIGEGAAGKTSLAKKIEDETYELQSDEKSTQGIDVIQWHFTQPNGQNFRVNIWDFGGQAIYHQTHQFFLTERSLYALVADTRKENTDFYYWLKVVELLSGNSPVLIIKNEKQDRDCEVNERQLRGEFTNLKEALSTNLATNRGLPEIKDAIQQYISRLDHVGTPWLKLWVRVRSALENDSRNYISLQEYCQLCRLNNLTDREEMLRLSRYLHDLGVCLHFQDDSTLKHWVILKPEWGTSAVYKVLDNKTVKKNLGCFTQDNLKDIWKDRKYAEMRDELLQLMMRFKLCYPIPNRSCHYIAPQLLEIDQADYTWDETNNLILRYKYEFMPKGILTRFIVETHPWIEQQKLVWRSGVVLNKNQTRAEVIEYYHQREIKVRVAGSRKKELLAVVTHELEKIHQSYERLKYQTLVPCNCEDCKGSQTPYSYPLDRLRKRLDAGRYQIECENSYEIVDVRRLIDDVNLQPFGREQEPNPQITSLQRELEQRKEESLKRPHPQPPTPELSTGNQPTMNYHDFQLLVTADRKIRASSEQGDEWGEFRLDMNKINLTLTLLERQQQTNISLTNAELLKGLGSELYQALFPTKIHGRLQATMAGAQANGYDVRLRLLFESPELAAIPWEFLYDEATNTFLANNTQTVLSRYIDIPVQKRDLKAANKPLKILLVISSPTNLDQLDVAGEERLIREALAKHIEAGQIELDVLPDATIRNINQKLREKPYNVFHYIGHGIFENNKGSIALVDRDGKYQLLDDEGFANFFLGNRSLGLAVLNSCQGAAVSSNQIFAGIAPNLVRRGIPAVVAMQYSILDTTAKIFADEFYRTLALNWPVDAAIQTTRNAISQEVGLDKPDFATPVLYMRAKDGMIMSGL